MGDDSQVGRQRAIPIRGWKIRFDSPPPFGASCRSVPGDILAMFQAWEEASGFDFDRRECPRYAPAETLAWVGWWKGGRFLVTRAELVNLSKGGALVTLGKRPPASQPVWMCLGSPHPVDYVQARVLDASPGIETKSQPGDAVIARLEFHSPCPPLFFLAAGQRVDERPLPLREADETDAA